MHFSSFFRLKKKELKLRVLNIKEKEFSPMTQASKSVAKERTNIIPSNLYAIVHDYLMQRFFSKRILSLKELKKWKIKVNYQTKKSRHCQLNENRFSFYETKIYVLENTSLSFHNHYYAGSCLFALNENLMNLGQNLAEYRSRQI